jgi:hypothetical protein
MSGPARLKDAKRSRRCANRMDGCRGHGVSSIAAVLAAAAAAVTSGAGAMAQTSAERMAEAASGFAVAPPPGYVAQPATSASSSEVAINLTKAGEPATSCQASFEAIPGFSQFSQDELNRQADQPNFDLFYRDSVSAFYAVATVAHFDHAGVRGAAIRATSRAKPATPGWRADLATLIFMHYTPKGLTKVTCTAAPAVFEPHRSEFEAVANAVTMPR